MPSLLRKLLSAKYIIFRLLNISSASFLKYRPNVLKFGRTFCQTARVTRRLIWIQAVLSIHPLS